MDQGVAAVIAGGITGLVALVGVAISGKLHSQNERDAKHLDMQREAYSALMTLYQRYWSAIPGYVAYDTFQRERNALLVGADPAEREEMARFFSRQPDPERPMDLNILEIHAAKSGVLLVGNFATRQTVVDLAEVLTWVTGRAVAGKAEWRDRYDEMDVAFGKFEKAARSHLGIKD